MEFLKECSLNNVKFLKLWEKMTGIPGEISILGVTWISDNIFSELLIVICLQENS